MQNARRINISNIVAYSADPIYASLILGMPGYDVEDVKDFKTVQCGILPEKKIDKTESFKF
jgi:thiamine monophosphate kinase